MNPVMIRNFKVPNLKFSPRPHDEIVFYRPTHPPPLDQRSATTTHSPCVNNNLSHNLIVVFDLSLSLIRSNCSIFEVLVDNNALLQVLRSLTEIVILFKERML